MRTNLKAVLAACALSLALAACGETRTDSTTTNAGGASQPAGAATSAPPNAAGMKSPPADVVRASAPAVEVRAGGRAEATVRLDIAQGYHVNANPPTHDYLIPTQLDLAPEPDVTAGKPAYPPALKKKFNFDPQPLAVYESEALIKFPVSVAAPARKGERTLRAKVRVQPCDDNACYPPRNVETTIALNVR